MASPSLSISSLFSTPSSTLISQPNTTSLPFFKTPFQSRKFISSPLRVASSSTTPTQQTTQNLQQKESQQAQNTDTNFSWRDHWYPVSLVEDLDPSRATPFQLLNRDLVIWFDNSSSQWVVFDDKCPHRLAPLSVCTSICNLILDLSIYVVNF